MSDMYGAMDAPDAAEGLPAAQRPQQPGMQGPPDGGPILASLMRQQQGPQVSAPGPGNSADSLTTLRTAIGLMQQALHGLPQGSQQHRDVLRALTQLSRHMPQGGGTAAVEQTGLMDMLRNIQRAPIFQKILQMFGGGQGGQGGQPTPPMPSTPLPGA